jgi:hypothetical protein
MPDFNNLPLILAGPILRRVEPQLVSVWVALSQQRSVEFGLWTGLTAGVGFFGNNTAMHTANANTIRIGQKLHIALVTLDLTAAPLTPGQIYSYNLVFNGSADLSSEQYLQDKGPATDRTQLALGFISGQLPSFALPPIELKRLQLVHGSCRKAHGYGPDGLAALDKMIERTHSDPFTRPHQLFLTGDQIYADDVAAALLPQLTVAGNALLGSTEQLTLKKVEAKIDATAANFPTTWRQELVQQQAKLTSGEADSHVMSFGEFCALYLFYWSNVLWDDLADKSTIFDIDLTGSLSDSKATCAEKIVNRLPSHLRSLYPANTRVTQLEHRIERIMSDGGNLQCGLIEFDDNQVEHFLGEVDRVKTFRKALPSVRRALANVPTYMIFDDHEITDDWYLTEDWRDKVLTAPLGVEILRNGLVSYALFQAWGNDPKQFEIGNNAQLLTLAQQLFSGATGPDTPAATQIDVLLGLDGSNSSIKWHYTVPTGPTTVVVLNTRTSRSFVGRYDPPGLISDIALDEQLPASLAPTPGSEVLIVVSAAPVLGLATIEEMAQPIGARANADFYNSVIKNNRPKITGYLEWDMEAWALDTPRFEALLARLYEMGKVVLLSGDVHYSFSAEMDYWKWKQGQPEPARIVQVTASALKNAWDTTPKRILETVTAQEIAHNAFYPVSRLGWDSPLDLVGNLNVPGGAMPTPLRALLRRTPTVIPIEGWPAGTALSIPPEWAWRTSLVKDIRPDDSSGGARPAEGQVGSISPDLVNSDSVPGYVKVMQRADKLLKNKIARSIVFATNLGLITFSGTGETLKIQHSLMFMHPDEDKPGDPKAYTQHEMSLAPTSDSPPTIA